MTRSRKVKTVTIEIEDDDVVVVLHRPEEGYEDVHPRIVAEDLLEKDVGWYELPWLDHYNEKWEQ
jgi:methyl coenzyme M reductase gamma subunit